MYTKNNKIKSSKTMDGVEFVHLPLNSIFKIQFFLYIID